MSYVTNVLTQLPFGNIIGGPLKAAIDAQVVAARATVDFIREVGFQKQVTTDPMFPATADTDADFGKLRTVSFTYQTQTEQTPTATPTQANSNRNVTLTVPLLTIIPIPYLRIDEMTIDFMVKITEEVRSSQTATGETAFNAGVNGGHSSFWSPVKVDFNTSLSTKHSSTGTSSSRYSTEATMNIHVRAVQDGIPAGMSRILTILEAAIKEKATTPA